METWEKKFVDFCQAQVHLSRPTSKLKPQRWPWDPVMDTPNIWELMSFLMKLVALGSKIAKNFPKTTYK